MRNKATIGEGWAPYQPGVHLVLSSVQVSPVNTVTLTITALCFLFTIPNITHQQTSAKSDSPADFDEICRQS